MSERKFSGINGPIMDEQVSADYEQAQQFEKVKIGKLGVYFRDGLRLRFLSYELLDRVFIRIQEVNGKLCCGNTVLSYYRLVFVKDGKEIGNIMSENEKTMDAALAQIAENAPCVKIGVEQRG